MLALDDWNARAQAAPRPGFLREVLDAGARHGDGPVCVHRTPLVLDQADLRMWQRVLPRMHRILGRVRAALLADLDRGPEGLAARLGLPPDAVEWASIDPGFEGVAPLARLDAYIVDGVPRFLELNAESPAGMGYASALAPLLLGDPGAIGVPGLSFLDPIPHVVATIRALWAQWARWAQSTAFDPGGGRMRDDRQRSRPSIAIVDRPSVATAPEFDLLAAAFRRRGHPAVVAAPEALTFDGERLRAGEFVIDVVFRRLLVSDIRRDLRAAAPLLTAYRAGRVCMVNSLRTVLLHDKRIFALLHDPAFPLSDEDRRFVGRHIPLTLRLDDAARERVRTDPARWVLKPAAGHGGQGVVLGWTVSRATWERVVEATPDAIVQERVVAPRGRFLDARDGEVHERTVDLGPFLARGRLAGFLCRVAEGELANVSAGGASQVPVFSTVRRC
ncbi:MAG: hypothetical protein EXR71_01620 [Myxococcales bacterium]|nr:hypothetical protein [Myxococcales bacterium]